MEASILNEIKRVSICFHIYRAGSQDSEDTKDQNDLHDRSTYSTLQTFLYS